MLDLLSDIGAFMNEHTLAATVLGGLTLRGFFEYAQWIFAFLLAWLVEARRVWRKFRHDWKKVEEEVPLQIMKPLVQPFKEPPRQDEDSNKAA